MNSELPKQDIKRTLADALMEQRRKEQAQKETSEEASTQRVNDAFNKFIATPFLEQVKNSIDEGRHSVEFPVGIDGDELIRLAELLKGHFQKEELQLGVSHVFAGNPHGISTPPRIRIVW